jgi:hypothetical protein
MIDNFRHISFRNSSRLDGILIRFNPLDHILSAFHCFLLRGASLQFLNLNIPPSNFNSASIVNLKCN